MPFDHRVINEDFEWLEPGMSKLSQSMRKSSQTLNQIGCESDVNTLGTSLAGSLLE